MQEPQSVARTPLACLETSFVHAGKAYQLFMLVQDAREQLKSSQHELAAIQKQRDDLARRLAHVAEKISSGMIPDLVDLTVPEHIKAAAQASASTVAVRPMPPCDSEACRCPEALFEVL